MKVNGKYYFDLVSVRSKISLKQVYWEYYKLTKKSTHFTIFSTWDSVFTTNLLFIVNQPLFENREQFIEGLSNVHLIFGRSIKNFEKIPRYNNKKKVFEDAVDRFLEQEKRYLIWRELVVRALERRTFKSYNLWRAAFDRLFISKAEIGQPHNFFPLD